MRFTPVLQATDLLVATLLFCFPASSVALAGTYAFVTNQNSSDVSVLDLESQTEIRRIPVPGKPAGVAVSPVHGSFYTVSPDSKTVHRFSLKTCEEIAHALLPGGPTGITVAHGLGKVFVSDWYNARVFVLDATTLSHVADLATGSAPAGVVVSPNEGWFASADRDADQVSIFDLPSMDLRHRVTVGTRPFGIAIGPDERLHVANVGTHDISVVDPDTGTVVATVPVGKRPYGVGFAQGLAFSTDQYADTVTVYSLESLSPLNEIDVGEYPEGIEATPDGSLVVSTNWFSNTVSLINPATQTVVGEIETGDGPRAFGRFLYSAPEGLEPCRDR